MGAWRATPPKHAVKIGDIAAPLMHDRLADAGFACKMLKYNTGWCAIPDNPDDKQAVEEFVANFDPTIPTLAQTKAKEKEIALRDTLKSKLKLTDEEMDALLRRRP